MHRTVPCKYYTRGFCQFGNACKFLHQVDYARQLDSNEDAWGEYYDESASPMHARSNDITASALIAERSQYKWRAPAASRTSVDDNRRLQSLPAATNRLVNFSFKAPLPSKQNVAAGLVDKVHALPTATVKQRRCPTLRLPYSTPDNLSKEQLFLFEAPSFQVGNVPDVPPPPTLC